MVEPPKLAEGPENVEDTEFQSTLPHSGLEGFIENVNLETVSQFPFSGFELSDDSDDESVVFEQSSHSTKADDNKSETMNADDVAKLLSDHTEKLATHWHDQMVTLTKALEQSNETPRFARGNSVSMPKFSGESTEDVNEFLITYNRAAQYFKLNNSRKAEMLPLHLTGNANIWFNTTPGLSGKNFDDLCSALKNQFHSDSDVWLLRQKLNERKQLPTESVGEFAADIRKIGQRINLPRSELMNQFIQGLRPELKSFVILQRPESFENAERHARLRESVQDPKPPDRTDEILKALANLQQQATAKEKSSIAAFDRTESRQSKVFPGESRPVTREEIAQIVSQQIRQEMRRNPQFSGQHMRGRRTLDGRPICDFCNKPGHIIARCLQRQNQGRDPRIPNANAPRGPTQSWGRPQYSSHAGNQNLN